jgi:hypothetical protein
MGRRLPPGNYGQFGIVSLPRAPVHTLGFLRCRKSPDSMRMAEGVGCGRLRT